MFQCMLQRKIKVMKKRLFLHGKELWLHCTCICIQYCTEVYTQSEIMKDGRTNVKGRSRSKPDVDHWKYTCTYKRRDDVKDVLSERVQLSLVATGARLLAVGLFLRLVLPVATLKDASAALTSASVAVTSSVTQSSGNKTSPTPQRCRQRTSMGREGLQRLKIITFEITHAAFQMQL